MRVSNTKKGFRREDRPGHLDPEHAARLLALTREEHASTSRDTNEAFLEKGREPGGPDLASRLAESAMITATTGQDELEEDPGGELGDTFRGMTVAEGLPFAPDGDDDFGEGR